MTAKRIAMALFAVLALAATRTAAMEYDIQTVAGDGVAGFVDGVPAQQARFNGPTGVVVDGSGNMYIADQNNNRIRYVPAGGNVTTYAGDGNASFGGDGGSPAAAQLNAPYGVYSTGTTVYISDQGNNRIRSVFAGTINTLAGTGLTAYNGTGIPATTANLSAPSGVTVGEGQLIFTDTGNNRIRQVNGVGTIVDRVGDGTAGYLDGTNTSAKINGPTGIVFEAGYDLLFADTANNRVRKMANNTMTSLISGDGTAAYAGDGGAPASASLNGPKGAVLAANNDYYIADTGNNVIRKFDWDAGIIMTVAGTGVPGPGGDGGPALQAQLNSPECITLDSYGNLYIADKNNHRIRRLAPRLAIKVSREMVPPNPVPGDPVVYRIVAENTGCATVTDLTVIDTIPSVIVDQAWDQPAAMTGPTVTSETGGTRYLWTESAIAFAPGESYTFTITGNLGQPCSPVSLSGTVWVEALVNQAVQISATSMFAYSAGDTVPPPPAQLTVYKLQSPPNESYLGLNANITYLIVATNTGAATLTGVTVWDTVSPILVGVASDQCCAITVPTVTETASGTLYVWYAPDMAPGVEYTFTLNGQVGYVCGPDVWIATQARAGAGILGCPGQDVNGVSSVTPVIAVTNGVVLELNVSRSPALPAVDSVLTYTATITNKSQVATVVPFEVLVQHPAAIAADYPSYTVTGAAAVNWVQPQVFEERFYSDGAGIGPGGTATIVFSLTNTCYIGWVDVDVSASSYNECGTALVTANNRFYDGPVLQGKVIAPAMVNVGDTFSVTVTVTDTGNIGADVLADMNPVNGNWALVSGPSPSGTQALASGGSLAVTWTYSVYGAGTITWVGGATGTPPCGTATDWSGVAQTAVGEAKLDGRITADRAVLGRTFPVVLRMENKGTARAASVVPSVRVDPGAGLVYRISGPDPAGPVDLAGGASLSFTWIYSAIGMGQVGFVGTASGRDPGGNPVIGYASLSLGIEPPDSLPVGAVQVGMQATTGSADQVYINPRRGDKYSFAMRPSEAGTVTVKVYNARGVKVWETSQAVSGSAQVSVPSGGWPGRDSSGDFLPSGAYYAIVTGPGLKFKTWIAIVN